MYAVIRHTFEIFKPEPKNLSSHKSFGRWKHYSWVYESHEEAMQEAIKMLDSPLLKANEHYLKHAIERLEEDNFFQVGRESVAVSKVAKNLAESESRSVNKQIIHMIHKEAKANNIVVEDTAEQEGKQIYSGLSVGFDANGSPVYDEVNSGLSKLAEKNSQVLRHTNND